MKLVIDIPDNYNLANIKNGSIASQNILNAVRNGKPLPKEHGMTEQEAENLEFVSDLLNGDLTAKLYEWVEETEEEFIFHTLVPWYCDEELKIVNKDWLRKAIALYSGIEKAKTNGDVIRAMFPNIDNNFSNVLDLRLWWGRPYKAESEVSE